MSNQKTLGELLNEADEIFIKIKERKKSKEI